MESETTYTIQHTGANIQSRSAYMRAFMWTMIVCWVLNVGPDLSTGVGIKIPKIYYGKIPSRLGLALKSNTLAFEGTIDSDYTGEK